MGKTPWWNKPLVRWLLNMIPVILAWVALHLEVYRLRMTTEFALEVLNFLFDQYLG